MPEQMRGYPIAGGSAREIAATVEGAIEAGSLVPGDVLPSVRVLAGQLGVSPGTVAAAIRDLRVRGVVSSEQRRRVRVASRPPVLHAQGGLVVPPGARDLSSGNADPA